MKKNRFILRIVVVIATCLATVTAPKINAQIHEVNDFESFQAAIAVVNAGAGGDTIKVTGDILLTANPTTIRKSVTITADTNDDGTPKHTISGNEKYNGITCNNLENCIIENLNITQAKSGISVTLQNVNSITKIDNCYVSFINGDGIYVNCYDNKSDNNTITISNCVYKFCLGGILIRTGISNISEINIINCEASESTSTSPSSTFEGYGIRITTGNNFANENLNAKIFINGCKTNNNKNYGITTINASIINCIANGNDTGIYAGQKSTVTDCTAYNNTSRGFYLASDIIVNNCVATNNGVGFYGYLSKITNCIANGNGFELEHCIVNNCSSIGNIIYGDYEVYGDGFSLKGCIISNSTALYNGNGGIVLEGNSGVSSVINCTAFKNYGGGITYFYDRGNIYNSIVYDNGRMDSYSLEICCDIKCDTAYNSVYKTGYVNIRNNCSSDNPDLIWVNASGEPVTDLKEAAYYMLGNESSALGLADKSVLNLEKMLDVLFNDYWEFTLEERVWFETNFTDEYLNNILMYDQLCNVRAYDGDRYDAGSIAGNLGANPVLNYAPRKSANYGKTSITFYGNGFDNNTKFTLKKSGESDIIADTTIVNTSKKCSATFNLHNKKIGKWDIMVILTDTIFTIKDGFELEEYIEPKIELEILGVPTNIAKGRTQTVTIKYVNKGNVSAYLIPVIVEMITDKIFDVEVNQKWEYIHTDEVYTDKTVVIDDVEYSLDGTDVLSGEGNRTTLVTPVIPEIPPYGKGYLSFDVIFWKHSGPANNEPVEIKAYTLPSLASVNGSNTLWDCLQTVGKLAWDLAKIPMNAIPGVGCGVQIGESIAIVGMSQGTTSGKALNATWEFGKVIAYCAADFIPGGAAVKMAAEAFKVLSTANDMVGHATGIIKCASGLSSLFGRLVGSCDPNDKIGPVSASGSTAFSDRNEFTYIINFENDPKATAPAQEVWITDTLDLNVFDIKSFEAGIMKIGDRIIDDIPFNTQNYTWSIDMSNDDMDLITEITLKLDKSKGIASWYFKSIDPATGELPTDALVGFLPPNDEDGAGQGFVMFTIKLKEELADDVTVANKASIVFDLNEPIITPEWVNKKDIVPPTSAMIRPANSTGEVELTWNGEDNIDGSGIYSYDIYMKKDDGYYEKLITRTKAPSIRFTVEDGVKYSFFSIATDNAGNVEIFKTEPDITIPFDNLDFDTYAVTKWNNTFMLNLKRLTEDGYDVSDCNWFKNNQLIGEGFSYSAGPKITDILEAGTVYCFRIITNEGDELASTNKVVGVQTKGLRVYPNPVPKGYKLTIEGTTLGSPVEIYNCMGVCVSSTIAEGSVTELLLALPPSIYIIRSNNEIVKVVIQ